MPKRGFVTAEAWVAVRLDDSALRGGQARRDIERAIGTPRVQIKAEVDQTEVRRARGVIDSVIGKTETKIRPDLKTGEFNGAKLKIKNVVGDVHVHLNPEIDVAQAKARISAQMKLIRPKIHVETEVDRNFFQRGMLALVPAAIQSATGIGTSFVNALMPVIAVGLPFILVAVFTAVAAAGAAVAAATVAGLALGTVLIGAIFLASDRRVRGAVGNLGKTIMKGLTQAVQPLRGPFVEAIKIIGHAFESILPTVKAFFREIAKSGGIQALATGIANMIKAFINSGVLTKLAQQFGPAMAEIAKQLPALGLALAHFFIEVLKPDSIKALGQFLWLAAQTIRYLGNTIGWLTMAFQIMISWWAMLGKIGPAVSKVWVAASHGVMTAAHAVRDAVLTAIRAIIGAWNATSGAVMTAAHAVRDAVMVAVRAIVGAWNAAAGGVMTAAHAVRDAVLVAVRAIVGAWNWLWHWAATYTNFIAGSWRNVGNIIASVVNFIAGWWGALIGAAKRLWGILNQFFNFIAGAWRGVGNIVAQVVNFIAGWWGALIGAGRRLWVILNGFFNFIVGAWRGVGHFIAAIVNTIAGWWGALINAAHNLWVRINTFANLISIVWANLRNRIAGFVNNIRGAIQLFIAKGIDLWNSANRVAGGVIGAFNTLKRYTIAAFNATKDGVGKVWDGIKAKVRDPIVAVVETVYNRGIVAFWNATVGKIPGIKGLPAVHVPKFDQGGYTGDGDRLEPAGIVHRGEFVMPKDKTARYLPTLMRMWKGYADGGPVLPGFADGGLVPGWAKGLIGGVGGILASKAVKHMGPGIVIKTLQPIINWTTQAAAHVPGEKSVFLDVARRMPKIILDTAVNYIKSLDIAPTSGLWGGGGVPGIEKWLRAQDHKPYIWASAGPKGYDCSGLVSAVYNLIHGRNPYNHTFSTHTMGSLFKGKPGGLLTVGWANANERGGGSVGHTAGVFNGIPFESGGSHGNVSVGHRDVTPLRSFAHVASLVGAEKMVKAHLISSGATQAGGTLGSWIRQAIGLTHVNFARWSAGLRTLIMRESGGRPDAVNRSDSNAAAGHPSMGLAQVIGPTFATYHWPGTSNNILDPVANIAAAINYILHRYGDISRVQQANPHLPPRGYDLGGWLPDGGVGVNTSGYAEPVFTHDQWEILKHNIGGGMHIDKVIIDAKSVKEMQDVIDFFKKVEQTARAGARS
jgi:phage-related protein